MIRLDDRISEVLARDDRLLDVLIGAAPVFEKLRNPLLRKTMTKLATVQQAARVAGIDANDLLARLNRALEGSPASAGVALSVQLAGEPPPAFVAATVLERIVELDVREDLRAGREPFGRILDAVRRLPDDHVLRLRAIFEPAPLYAVLRRQGFEHYTERLGPEDWRVWFHRSGVTSSEAIAQPAATGAGDEHAVVLDVRGLEPPEPMVRTLEALHHLRRGQTLVQINVRIPQLLLPKLSERGFVYEIREQSTDLVRVFIRHATP